ncbi:MAG TPA: hypothetical protein VGR26_04645 [Acidimicrobiales bacterium]|nr:hypothetical protein [Acidimicrobiales bacterium]
MPFIDHNATTGLTQANASAHLCCLWDCGLVARDRKDREVHYRLVNGVKGLLAAAEGAVAVAVAVAVAGHTNFGSSRKLSST